MELVLNVMKCNSFSGSIVARGYIIKKTIRFKDDIPDFGFSNVWPFDLVSDFIDTNINTCDENLNTNTFVVQSIEIHTP